ncbi:MAG TPA: bifunctional diguanylate cyclase/phosphodiesterase [Dehalococcoidia bacterium]|nr:bifunctional diguanylate cyclase/phosphodiesterase [Dehalococcoidia bacterium]
MTGEQDAEGGSGGPAPTVVALLAWSRRLIAVFLTVALFSFGWSVSDVSFEESTVSFQLRSLWSVALLGVATCLVGLTVFLRRLARHVEEEIRYFGSLDVLTGLANRAGLMERLHRPAIAVLYLDIDYFKNVNDSLGHDSGDEVIRMVAQRLRRAVRPGDLAARLGGDEFVVVIEDEDIEQAARGVAEKIRSAVSQPLRIERRELLLTSSIGVAVKSPQLATPNEVLRAADLALYRAKRQGRDRVVFYSESSERNVLYRLDLEKDLWKAMDRGELELHYLPEVNLQTGALCGLEALVRWRHPAHGVMRPSSFMGLAEETGSISEIGLWSFEAACRDLKSLRRAGSGEALAMSVNLSRRQLGQPGFIRRLEEVLLATDVDPADIKVEVSEQVFLEAGAAQMATVDQMRALGLGIVIDDFGTGHAPLSYLRRWSVDGVKIDRSLIGNIEFDESKLLIVQAIISLAHDLGLRVTAVGIETPQQLSQLFDLGCDFGQGFYLSEPVPAEAVARLLAKRRARTPPRRRPAA